MNIDDQLNRVAQAARLSPARCALPAALFDSFAAYCDSHSYLHHLHHHHA